LVAIGLIATATAVAFWVARQFQTITLMADSAPEVDTQSIPRETNTRIPGKVRTTQVIEPTHATVPSPVSNSSDPSAAAAGTNQITEWESAVDEVLGLDAEPSEVGKKLLKMLPQLPTDGRMEALQHAVNLLADADYEPIGKMFTDPKVTEDEVELLLRDVLNRSNAIKLPLLLQVARTAGHPKAGEAREILEVFLGEDYGEEWETWQGKLDEFLKEEAKLAATEQP